MSIYELFNVEPTSHPYDIEKSIKSRLRAIKRADVMKQWSINGGNVEDIDKLIEYMKFYIIQSGMIILNPSSKNCYDAWLKSIDSTSSSLQTLTYHRIKWFNAHRTSECVSFDEILLKELTLAVPYKVKDESTPDTYKSAKGLKCRWCDDNMDLKMKTHLIYQCKCTARIGHENCARKFDKEYKGRCPVCRSTLLPRRDVSKYMFWSIDNKYKI